MTNFIKICWTILTTKYADRQRGVIYFMHLEHRKHKKVNKKLYKIPTYENDKNSVSQGIMIYMWKPQRIVQEGWVNYSYMQHACYTLWNIKLFHFLVPACSADISTTGSERTAYITQKQALLESHMYLQVRSRNTQLWERTEKWHQKQNTQSIHKDGVTKMVRGILLLATPAISTPPGSKDTTAHSPASYIPSHPHNIPPYDQSYCLSHILMWIFQTDFPYQDSVCTVFPT